MYALAPLTLAPPALAPPRHALARAAYRAGAALLACVLTACSTAGGAIMDAFGVAMQGLRASSAPRLNPGYQYLRVVRDGRVAFVALGNVEADPEGPVEVWYSAEREVIRLRNGRLVGAVGLTTEWRSVTMPELPSWRALRAGGAELRWTRLRDVMPGYRYGVRDALVLRAVAPARASALQGLDAQKLAWFEERFEPAGAGRAAPLEEALPVARYAVSFAGSSELVVYGEQCLSPSICFSWQRWPAEPQSANARP